MWRVATPDIFRYHFYGPEDETLEAFQAYITRILGESDRYPFAMVLNETGDAVGTTSFMDVRPAHRGLEIGSTWIGKPYQGTHVNPENKYILLRHAFETLGAVRVQLKTDGRNLHSQRAIEKLGTVREGTLRKHIILPDGYRRDSVMFSITDEEWPAVKAGLEARLGYVP
jgi:ribosomal-protein-alanine N-acetyltransferase